MQGANSAAPVPCGSRRRSRDRPAPGGGSSIVRRSSLLLLRVSASLVGGGTLAFLFEGHHLIHTAFVTATGFELRIEENPHHRIGVFRLGVARAEGEDIRVV